MLPMTEEKRQEILAQNKAMADKALRVLAAAEPPVGGRPARGLTARSIWSRICASWVWRA